jgi:hypothetical protein
VASLLPNFVECTKSYGNFRKMILDEHKRVHPAPRQVQPGQIGSEATTPDKVFEFRIE